MKWYFISNVLAGIILVISLGIVAYLVRRGIKLQAERLETFNRFVTVLEKLERTLEELRGK